MGNNPVKFSYKQIWFIAYPILISLVMEQLIGMTDTAFMGRVGEVELGASAIAGVYYMTFYMIAFGFSLISFRFAFDSRTIYRFASCS